MTGEESANAADVITDDASVEGAEETYLEVTFPAINKDELIAKLRELRETQVKGEAEESAKQDAKEYIVRQYKHGAMLVNRVLQIVDEMEAWEGTYEIEEPELEEPEAEDSVDEWETGEVQVNPEDKGTYVTIGTATPEQSTGVGEGGTEPSNAEQRPEDKSTVLGGQVSDDAFPTA